MYCLVQSQFTIPYSNYSNLRTTHDKFTAKLRIEKTLEIRLQIRSSQKESTAKKDVLKALYYELIAMYF